MWELCGKCMGKTENTIDFYYSLALFFVVVHCLYFSLTHTHTHQNKIDVVFFIIFLLKTWNICQKGKIKHNKSLLCWINNKFPSKFPFRSKDIFLFSPWSQLNFIKLIKYNMHTELVHYPSVCKETCKSAFWVRNMKVYVSNESSLFE